MEIESSVGERAWAFSGEVARLQIRSSGPGGPRWNGAVWTKTWKRQGSEQEVPWRESSPVQRKGRESSAEMGSCLVYVGNSQEVSFGGAEWGATLTVETLDIPMDGIWEIRQSEESRISQGLIFIFFHFIPFWLPNITQYSRKY